MTPFKYKLHHLISGQLPEYIVEEFPLFTKFLEAYYEFLDEPGEAHDLLLNSKTWQDIDLTLDLFVPYFKRQLAADVSDQALLNSRRIIKYIYDFYEAKGSENAVELFFRFMYNEAATVVYPGDYVLRPSDGQWSRQRIMKLDASGYQDKDIFALKGSTFQITYLEDFLGAGTKRYTITLSCFNVVRETEDIYQLDVDIDPAYQFPAVISQDPAIGSMGTYDTHVYVLHNGERIGVLTKQLVSVKSIDVPGKNFRVDDSYQIGETGIIGQYFAGTAFAAYVVIPFNPNDAYVLETYSNDAVIRVSEVSTTIDDNILGQVNQFQIVDTGKRFTARESNSISTQPYVELDYSYLDGFPSTNSTSYAQDIAAIVPVDTFTLDLYPTHGAALLSERATITFNTGLVFYPPSSFKDSSGFLSDINKLQDNYYYQPFSYVIRSEQAFSKWKSLYTRTAHPAGFKAFAELQFVDTVDATSTILELPDEELVVIPEPYVETTTTSGAPLCVPDYLLEHTLKASDRTTNFNFGIASATSADGSVIVVGAPSSASGEGTVYAYSGASYATETILSATSPLAVDQLGFSIACSADGSVIVAGAPGNGTSDAGRVIVFSGTDWTTQTVLTASDGAASDQFGCAVACSADGSTIIVSAREKNGAGFDRGKVYVYNGSSWSTETKTLVSPAPVDDEEFGYVVACSSDASIIVVGNDSSANNSINGYVHVFSGSNWTTETTLVASDGVPDDWFGKSVACSADGSSIVVGAPGFAGDYDTVKGSAYIYTGALWSTEAKVQASDGVDYDNYGFAVACSTDGSVVAVGATDRTTYRGAIYVHSGSAFVNEDIHISSEPLDYATFGASVSMTPDTSVLIAGANGWSGGRGLVDVFTSAPCV